MCLGKVSNFMSEYSPLPVTGLNIYSKFLYLDTTKLLNFLLRHDAVSWKLYSASNFAKITRRVENLPQIYHQIYPKSLYGLNLLPKLFLASQIVYLDTMNIGAKL